MINLLLPDIKSERKYGRYNRALLGYSIILITTASLVVGIMTISLRFVGADEPKLKEEIANSTTDIISLEGNIKSVESIAERLESAKKLSDLSVNFSELIPKIGAVLPQGVVLNGLSLTGGFTDPLKLDVSMATANLAPVLIRNLVESDLFEAADVATITPSGSGGTGTEGEAPSKYNFSASLTASFTGSAEAKRKAAAAEAAKQAEAAAAAANTGAQ